MRQTATILIVTTIMFAMPLNGNAQKRYSMLDGNPEWVYYSYNCGYLSRSSFRFYRFYIDGDTTVNGKVYKKLWYDIYDRDGNHLTMDPWSKAYMFEQYRNPPFVCAYLRQDGNRIYGDYMERQNKGYLCQRDSPQAERFIYDFSLQKGDTLTVEPNGDLKDWTWCRVKRPVLNRFPVTLADGTTRDAIQLFFCDSVYSDDCPWKEFPGYHDNYIIEGIGCINSQCPLLDYTYVTDVYRHFFWGQPQYCSRLNMFRQYGKIVYLAPEHVEGTLHDEKYYTFHKMPFYPDIDVTMAASIVEEETSRKTERESTGTYNIMGQKLSDVRKGINIIDGKKILIK